VENTKKNPYFLNVALDNGEQAKGELFIDDGESLNSVNFN
jgi:hypothetical protein